jgi:3-oxoacyl-[acyl-carrier protein] reductase
MSDFFLSLGRNPLARKVVRQAGLPIPLPEELTRQRAPWAHKTLAGKTILVGGREQRGRYGDMIGILNDAGATVLSGAVDTDGVLFDASALTHVSELADVYSFFHNCVGKIKRRGHVVILAGSARDSAESAAVSEALTGFTRSLAKELGGRGISVNMLRGPEGALLGGPLRFLLSDHGSFITGQVIELTAGGTACMRFDKLLEGRVIFITGAAQGIGAAVARRVAAEGAKVLLLDRPQELHALESLAREVHGTIIPVDLLKDDAVEVTLKKLRELAPIHGVVHNAGITRDKSLFNMSPDRWDAVLKLNLLVPQVMTDLMLGKELDFITSPDCSFVYLSSVGGIAGNPGQCNYAASKAGLIGYTRHLATNGETGSRRFNCIAPGFIETKMTQSMPRGVRELARRFNSFQQGGEPDDIAQAVTFMLSEASSSLNGETLRVCGQNLIGR